MLVFACIGPDTRVVLPMKEYEKEKDKEPYNTYIFYEIEDTEYCFGYPLYSSKSKITERLKRSCKIKPIKTFNKKLYESIKEREDRNIKIKETLGINLDDPFDIDFQNLWRM